MSNKLVQYDINQSVCPLNIVYEVLSQYNFVFAYLIFEAEVCSAVIFKQKVSQWLMSIGAEASEDILKSSHRQPHNKKQ